MKEDDDFIHSLFGVIPTRAVVSIPTTIYDRCDRWSCNMVDNDGDDVDTAAGSERLQNLKKNNIFLHRNSISVAVATAAAVVVYLVADLWNCK